MKKFSDFPPCTKEWYIGEYERLLKEREELKTLKDWLLNQKKFTNPNESS
jgi:predicted component of type VI protein secretion system